MDFRKHVRVGFQLCLLLVVTCSLLTSAEENRASVVTSQRDGETCSYVLTVPKEPCKCDCIKEFQQMTMDYERRLGEVERMLLRVLDALPQEDDYVDTQSSDFRIPSMDSVPEFFPVLLPKPFPTQEEKHLTTPVPSKQGIPEKIGITEEKNFVKPTPKPSKTMTVQPFVAEHDDEEEERTHINLQMTADVEEIPRKIQVGGMSGSLVIPDSSEVPTVDLPPVVETAREAGEDIVNHLPFLEPPALPIIPIPVEGIEINLPAHKSEGITSADIEELTRALKFPHVVNRPRTDTPTEEDDEEDVDEEEETQTRRPPPGFASGMEKSAGFAGDFNRPQWKKLEEFLEAAKNETVKRERPAGIERETECDRDGCGCLLSKGRSQNGIYRVPNVPESGKRGVLVELYCDLETMDGGWTVIQRRQNGSANFYRNWNHYAHGFGYLDSSFWIGNRLLHALTKRLNYELRIEFTDWDGKTGFAEYDRFYIGPEEGNFQLALGKFLGGNRGNAFSYHNGSMFSTFDRDNDKSTGECAVLRQAGFWFKNCNRMNPNGRWIPFADATGLNGAVITWGTWSRHLFTYSMKDFRMMIRPTDSADFA